VISQDSRANGFLEAGSESNVDLVTKPCDHNALGESGVLKEFPSSITFAGVPELNALDKCHSQLQDTCRLTVPGNQRDISSSEIPLH
jgi:hypothetical protein